MSVTEASEKTQMVYVIGSPGGLRVKIGTSGDVSRRLAELRNSSPVELEVLWQQTGGTDLETALHRRFKTLRAHGEWFDFPDGDPITAIAAAAAEEQAKLVLAKEERASEPMVLSETPGGTVVLMNGVLMVMPPHTEGGWRCVAWDTQRQRRCHRPMDDSSIGVAAPAQWIVPGLGVVSGRSVDANAVLPGDEVAVAKWAQQLLMQVCRSHEDSDESQREPAAWRPFDLARDRHLVMPTSLNAWDFGLAPGLEEMEAAVRKFAETLTPGPAG
jgi:hypothetical protein